jgi:uncharacterized Zn finger protein
VVVTARCHECGGVHSVVFPIEVPKTVPI